jgi:hypothetical protein
VAVLAVLVVVTQVMVEAVEVQVVRLLLALAVQEQFLVAAVEVAVLVLMGSTPVLAVLVAEVV